MASKKLSSISFMMSREVETMSWMCCETVNSICEEIASEEPVVAASSQATNMALVPADGHGGFSSTAFDFNLPDPAAPTPAAADGADPNPPLEDNVNESQLLNEFQLSSESQLNSNDSQLNLEDNLNLNFNSRQFSNSRLTNLNCNNNGPGGSSTSSSSKAAPKGNPTSKSKASASSDGDGGVGGLLKVTPTKSPKRRNK